MFGFDKEIKYIFFGKDKEIKHESNSKFNFNFLFKYMIQNLKLP